MQPPKIIPNSSKPNLNKKGLTTLQMLTVVALLGLFAGWLIPFLIHYFNLKGAVWTWLHYHFITLIGSLIIGVCLLNLLFYFLKLYRLRKLPK